MRPLADISKIYTERENLAAHKFHQRQIMEKAKRRNLVVQYYNWEWKFLDPETGRSISHKLWLMTRRLYG